MDKSVIDQWSLCSRFQSHLSLGGSPGRSSSPAAHLHPWWRPAWGSSGYWSSAWPGSGHLFLVETNSQQRPQNLFGPNIVPAGNRSRCHSRWSAQRSRNRPAHGCSCGKTPAWRRQKAARRRWRRSRRLGRWTAWCSCCWCVCESVPVCRWCPPHYIRLLTEGLFTFPSMCDGPNSICSGLHVTPNEEILGCFCYWENWVKPFPWRVYSSLHIFSNWANWKWMLFIV